MTQAHGTTATTPGTRGKQLAQQFSTLIGDTADLVERCSDDEWRATSVAEEWSVAAVAHHIGEVQGAFARILAVLASGETFSPNPNMDDIHESNAQHAENYKDAGKAEVLDVLRTNAASIVDALEGLGEEDLDRVAGDFGGNPLTLQQFTEYVVIGHAREHYESMKATLAHRPSR